MFLQFFLKKQRKEIFSFWNQQLASESGTSERCPQVRSVKEIPRKMRINPSRNFYDIGSLEVTDQILKFGTSEDLLTAGSLISDRAWELWGGYWRKCWSLKALKVITTENGGAWKLLGWLTRYSRRLVCNWRQSNTVLEEHAGFCSQHGRISSACSVPVKGPKSSWSQDTARSRLYDRGAQIPLCCHTGEIKYRTVIPGGKYTGPVYIYR